MTQRFSSKVAIVTGGARGIGAATVRRLVAEGAEVVVTDILVEQGEALCLELGVKTLFVRHDVSCRSSWDELVERVLLQFKRIDVLVNNAGIAGTGATLLAEDQAGYDQLVGVNQTGVFHGIKAIAPVMAEGGGGSIVNVSSIAGLVAWPGLGAYAATKFAVVGLTKTAAAELGRLNIRVNCVHPGVTDTPIIDSVTSEEIKAPLQAAIASTPLGRIGKPEEIAAAIAFFASDDGSFCTGASLAIDGGWTAV
jgi:3alpha(or 20beta)-hydroxysteroid dehydrogenase